jgi:D-serine deaminase-like pyridoxal phosphate-dependent protein
MIPDPEEKRLAISKSLGLLADAKNHLEEHGLNCRIVSAGGSGSYEFAADVAGPTELQAGGGIFACRYYTEGCGVKGHTPAISVWTTVVSRPTDTRAVLDAGFKSMSAHKQNPVVRDHPQARILNLSAEHVIVELESQSPLKIGSKLHIIPGYSDLTFVLHDRVLGYRGGRVQSSWELWGRGKLQ